MEPEARFSTAVGAAIVKVAKARVNKVVGKCMVKAGRIGKLKSVETIGWSGGYALVKKGYTERLIIDAIERVTAVPFNTSFSSIPFAICITSLHAASIFFHPRMMSVFLRSNRPP
jgi:hypothetical protein